MYRFARAMRTGQMRGTFRPSHGGPRMARGTGHSENGPQERAPGGLLPRSPSAVSKTLRQQTIQGMKDVHGRSVFDTALGLFGNWPRAMHRWLNGTAFSDQSGREWVQAGLQ